MAKSAEVSIPSMDYKPGFEPATAEEAFSAIAEAREGTMMRVPLDAIHPVSDYNIRVHTPAYEAHIEKIKDSIIKNGFYPHMPLKVFPASENGQNLLYLVGGYTRYEAAKRAIAAGAKIARLPVVPTPKGASMDDLLIGLDRDNDGMNLSPFEKGILVKRLQANDNDDDEIASALGITKQYVSDLLLLMGAPKRLHNMIINGEVAANFAIELIKEHGSGKKALEVLTDAGAKGDKEPKGGGTTRVTRSTVAKKGGTQKGGKKVYEGLIEYLIVLNSQNGPQSAMDFLVRWNEKDEDAVKELAKVIAGPKKKKEKKPNPKDVRIPIKKSMTDEEKATARAHNKEVQKRAERREKKAAKAAAETPSADEDPV